MEKDLETLRRFNRKVARLEESGFAQRYAEDVPNVVAKFEEPAFRNAGGGTVEIIGRVTSHLEDFNQDEIDAYILTHRILTHNNDPLAIGRLAKIYDRPWMPEEARACFHEARTQLNQYLDSTATIQFEEYHITIRQLADVVINGGLAHSNDQKSIMFENWINSGISGILWAEFCAYALELLRYFRYFRALNRAVIEQLGPSAKDI